MNSCCLMMEYWLNKHCPSHPEPEDYLQCPDHIVYQASDNSIGIRIFDGGSSFVAMAYCPWCATELEDGEWVDCKKDPAPEAITDQSGDPGRRIDLGL